MIAVINKKTRKKELQKKVKIMGKKTNKICGIPLVFNFSLIVKIL